jgi:hypothetical protein
VSTRIELAGFQRLKAVCQYHGLPLEILAPPETVPEPGELVLGQPFDTLLSSLYRETSAAMLGDFQIYPWRDRENAVLRTNKGLRILGDEPYVSAFVFGQIPLLAYYLATVPALADAKGIQPVIFINGYEGDQVLPVASNVDAFFRVFSIYMERAVADPEYGAERRIRLQFPESVQDVVARDVPLVEAMSSGRFGGLLRTEASRQWISKVVGAMR